MSVICSRANPRVRRWRRLVEDAGERRREKLAIIEGVHLVTAFLDARGTPEALMVSESGQRKREIASILQRAGKAPAVLADAVFRSIADTDAPAGIAAEIALPRSTVEPKTSAGCVFLEGIQDPGNVGAILRNAAAFGIRDAVLGRGCADAWSPKVQRAAMGAHFGMRLVEHADLAALIDRFGGKVVCAVPHGGIPLASADLSGRLGWLLGAEGRGVSATLAARATLRVSIPMSGFSESLNVAAAAAICFYEASKRGARS